MVQLIGNVAGLGLPRLVQFMADLQLSGRLCLAPEPGVNTGAIFLQDGQIVGAVLDTEQGLPALEALVMVCANATFAFSDSPGEIKANLIAEPKALEEHLDHLGQEGIRLMHAIGSLTAVPRLAAPAGDAHETLALSRGAVRLLVDIRDEHTVLELGHAYGLRPTLVHLNELIELRLVTVETARSHLHTAAAPDLAQYFLRRDNNHEHDSTSTSARTDPTGCPGRRP